MKFVKKSLSKMGSKNPMWKGTFAKYAAIHLWVSKQKPKPKCCELCLAEPPHDLANISQKYYRDINDFEWLCRRCHMIKDGRMEKINKLNKLKGKKLSCKKGHPYFNNTYFRKNNIRECLTCKKTYSKNYVKQFQYL